MTKKTKNEDPLRRDERVKNLVDRKGLEKKEAEAAVDSVITTREYPEPEVEPRIKVTAKGEAYFEQGDIRFTVDADDLNNVVGANGRHNVIDSLMDSQIVTLATCNKLSVKPYARELITPVLTRLVQYLWYRDLENNQSAARHCHVGYVRYRMEYAAKLTQYVEEPEGNGNGSSVSTKRRAAASEKWTKTYKPSSKKVSVSGREEQVLAVIKGIKKGTLAQIVEAAKGKVNTKQDLQKIVARFLTSLIEAGAVEEA